MRVDWSFFMKTKVMIQKRCPKYFHSDGNGVHLKLNHSYKIVYDEKVLMIRVLKEYTHFYLVLVDEKYKMTINKLVNEFIILDNNK